MDNKKNVENDVVVVPVDISKITEENGGLPDPFKLSYYNDLNNRVIYLDDEIERDTITPIIRMIVAWNRNDKDLPISERRPIKIIINSYGGDIDATLSMVDIIKISKTPIYTYNVGVAMSGGFYILIAGHKKYALKNSQSLVHQGSGGFEGTAEEIKSHTAQYNKLLARLFDHVLGCTKIPKDLLNKKKKSEWFINGEDQVELGVVDGIITDIDELV